AGGRSGRAHRSVRLVGLAFPRGGGNGVPRFMAALPMVVAAGFWAGGVGAAVLVAPLLGACAVLTFGGLAARLTGPRGGPLAALAPAPSLPPPVTPPSARSAPLAPIPVLRGPWPGAALPPA